MAKKNLEENVGEMITDSLTFNPLLNALRENDKKNLFKSNAVTYFHKTGFPLFDYYFGSVINIHNELGEIIKQEPMIGQAAGTFNLVLANSGAGKALPNSTLIPTPNGVKRMGDIKVGDYVFDQNGKPTQVIGVYPQGKKDVWEVEFLYGKKAKCCEDHLWEYQYMSHRGYRTKVNSTKELLKYLYPEQGGKRNIIVRNNKSVQYNYQPIDIDPYTLGVFLGNGCCLEKYLTLSSLNSELPNKIARINNIDVVKMSDNNFSYAFYTKSGQRIETADFFKNLQSIVNCKSGTKSIPIEYIHNSENIRWQLLCGLIDTDGSVSIDNSRPEKLSIRYTSTSKQLIQDIKYLVQSLGLNATIGDDKRNNKYKSGYCGTISIIGDIESYMDKICSVSYKYNKIFKVVTSKEFRNRAKHTRIRSQIKIKDICKLDYQEEMTCIKVDNPEHLFLTEDFIVTHNTTVTVQVGANIIRQYRRSTLIHYDCESRFDISRGENISQLPISDFDEGGRYILKQGLVTLDEMQEAIVDLYVKKMRMKDELSVDTGRINEFGREIVILEPTFVIVDSITSVINESFSFNDSREVLKAGELRSNTAGARDAKTLKGFLKDIIPLCKEANIIIYAINHINGNMSMNAFTGPTKQQNFLKQDEAVPGGKVLIFYPFNILKMIAKPSDDFTEDSDGFNGHMVTFEPIKSSSNQSGNSSKGVSFDMVFSYKDGFDSLRSLILYAKEKGIIEGNKPRMKFKDDPSFTFAFKNIQQEKNEKPIWDCVKKYVIPELETHLSYVEPTKFDDRQLDY